jgi:hypothetical protein
LIFAIYTKKITGSKISTSPIKIIDNISKPLLREAARFKVTYNPSLADCFALATAFKPVSGNHTGTSSGSFMRAIARHYPPAIRMLLLTTVVKRRHS